MAYKENPKTEGSGILCCIPQSGECPMKCADCFFQSGRSYLEPLTTGVPNMPDPKITIGKVVRVNDGNDSNYMRHLVIQQTNVYRDRFFNTAVPGGMVNFPGPVVLTVNPGSKTDKSAYLLKTPPANLMFVRFRLNTWNVELAQTVIEHYTARGVMVVLTYMAYYKETVKEPENYVKGKRTTNNYLVIKGKLWHSLFRKLSDGGENKLVKTCGKGPSSYSCRDCGVCLEAYHDSKAKGAK